MALIDATRVRAVGVKVGVAMRDEEGLHRCSHN